MRKFRSYTIDRKFRKNQNELDPNGVTVRVEYYTKPSIRDYPWVGRYEDYILRLKSDTNVIRAYVVSDPKDLKQKGYV